MQLTIPKIWSLAIMGAALISLPVGSQLAVAQAEQPKIIHDVEYHILDALYGEKWAV